MEIIKLYTGEQVGGAAGMRSEQPDNRGGKKRVDRSTKKFLGNCKFHNLFMGAAGVACVPGNKSGRL